MTPKRTSGAKGRFVVAACLLVALGYAPAISAAGQLPFLLELHGDIVSVHYTPGGLDRASNLQERFELLTADVAKWTGEDLTLQVYVLSREEWLEAEISPVFGLPSRVALEGLGLPSWGDSRNVRIWQALLGHDLVTLPGMPMRGNPEEAATLAMSDILAGPEAAAILLEKAGFRGDREWVADVVAHVVTLSALLRHESTRLAEVERFWGDLGRAGEWPGLTSDEGKRLVARLRKEARYFEAAKLIHGEDGKPQAKAILKKARRAGRVIESEVLLEAYPSLASWIAEEQRESAASTADSGV